MTVNRLSTPLPDSVLDRYYAEHPDEVDPRRKHVAAKTAGLTKDDLDSLAPGAIVGRRMSASDRWTKNTDGTWTGEAEGATVGSHRDPPDGYEVLHDGKTAAVRQPTIDPGDFEDVFKP